MLNSWQLSSNFSNWKTLGMFFLLIFNFVAVSSALEFGVSPPSLYFTGYIDTILCENASVFSSIKPLIIMVSDRWTIERNAEKDISKYTLSGKDLGLVINYPESIYLNSKASIPICLTAEKEGNYKGILIFEALNGSLQIGSWINVKINGENIEGEEASNYITGFAISDKYLKAIFISPLILLNFLLFLVLFFLVKKRKKAFY